MVACIQMAIRLHMIKFKSIAIGLSCMAVMLLLNPLVSNAQDVIWKLDNINLTGNVQPQVLGTPAVKNADGRKAIAFNGVDDGLITASLPIDGWQQFTIEVLFKPDGDGPPAPRFIHFQDQDDNRGTFELRLNADKYWFLDTFLKNGKAGNKGLALNDSTLLHPADRWYWAAIVYDGKNMSAYVNGVKETEGIYNFPGVTNAQMSIGVRLNRVNWFKGRISEIRFHHAPLTPDQLQRIK